MEFTEEEKDLLKSAKKYSRIAPIYANILCFVLLCLFLGALFDYVQVKDALSVATFFCFSAYLGAVNSRPSYMDLYLMLESNLRESPSEKVDPIIEVLTRKP